MTGGQADRFETAECGPVSVDFAATGPLGVRLAEVRGATAVRGAGGRRGSGSLDTALTVLEAFLGLTKLLPACLFRQRGGSGAAEMTPDLHAPGQHDRSLRVRC